MLLFHASLNIIQNPDLHYGRKNADFGQGFYMTPDKEFAYRWARETVDNKCIVNIYSLDTENLKVKNFTRDEEWFNYIYKNRHGKQDILDADVIIGPIANDIIYDTLGITTSGFLNETEAMQLLMIGPEYVQVVIKSEKAKRNLKWLSSEELSSDVVKKYSELKKIEQNEFQELFAKELDKMS